MEDDVHPFIPADLIKYLEKQYPERCADPHQDERQIWMAVGARDVVRALAARYKEQSKGPQG